MALSKVDFNNINVTPAASKALKWNASANGFETGDLGGNMVLLSTQTASSSSTISFTSGIDSTYKEYIFKFIDIHPSENEKNFQVNFRDGGTDYDAVKTSTYFQAYHTESDSASSLEYVTARDNAQSTGIQIIGNAIGNANDESGAGTMHLFDPSNTTFVKHYIMRSNSYNGSDYSIDTFVAGYCNTTSAIDGVQFSFASGNIDAGTIKMYGIL
tara:strand:+ start:175 stop:816 length:642 start_codon:yes stop_codon:yes gene_type:complete